MGDIVPTAIGTEPLFENEQVPDRQMILPPGAAPRRR
jgi:hypothetical protein